MVYNEAHHQKWQINPGKKRAAPDLGQIGLNYIKTWFTLDVLACIPIDLVSRILSNEFQCSFAVNGCNTTSGSSSGQALKLLKLLRIFRLLKLLRLFRVSRLFERYQNKLIYWWGRRRCKLILA